MPASSKKSKVVSPVVSQASSTAGFDPVAATQHVESSMSESPTLTAVERKAQRAMGLRATGALVALVASMAEEGNGHVAGVVIDAAATRTAQAKAARLRVGANAARSIALRFMDEALTIEADNAKRTLAASSAMESLARAPEGTSFAPQVARLRAAAKEGARRKTRVRLTPEQKAANKLARQKKLAAEKAAKAAGADVVPVVVAGSTVGH